MKRILTQLVARRWALMALGVVFVFSAIMLWPTATHAQVGNIINFVEDPTTLIATILINIVGFLGKLLIQIINILIAVAQYNDFSHSTAIERGWVILRDIGNIFFIIVLMVIAFATILKIENYRYNRLLGRLVIMAVLVNFSKLIAGIFIDFTQIIMLTFVSAFQNAAAGNLAQGLGLTELLNLRITGSGAVTGGEIMTALILANVMLLISLVVVGVVTLVLIMRVLALWLLVVLSPIAYIARTFPLTERYSRLWWSNFGKYATSGPIMAFFLWLSFTIISTGSQCTGNTNAGPYCFNHPDTAEVSQSVGDSGLPSSITSTFSAVSDSDSIMSFIIAISLLIGSLTVTSQLGVAGGRFAGEASERVRRFAGRAAVLGGAGAVAGVPGFAAALFGRQAVRSAVGTAKSIPGYGERKLYSATGVGLSTRRIGEGVRQAFAERGRKDEMSGAGRAGQALQRGGIGGFLKGFGGAPRDWTEAYTRGFLGIKGIVRAGQTISGGEQAVEKVQGKIEREQERLEELKKKARVFTPDENKQMQDRLKGLNTSIPNLARFTSGASNSFGTSSLSEEDRLNLANLIGSQVNVLGTQFNNKAAQIKAEKDPAKIQVLQGEQTKLDANRKDLQQRYGNVIKLAKDHSDAEKDLTSARQAGDPVRIRNFENKVATLRSQISQGLQGGITLQPDWVFKDDWRGQMKSVQENMQEEATQLQVDITTPTVTTAEKNARQAEVQQSTSQLELLKPQLGQAVQTLGPQAFYALRDRRSLVHDEMKKVTTYNEDELGYMFDSAVRIGDRINAAAVMMRAAEAGHLNEIVNNARYEEDRSVTAHESEEGWEARKKGDKFDSNQQGLSDFFTQIMGKKLGMSQDEYLSLQSDVSDIAQENNHWAMAQSIGLENGKLYQHSPLQQATRVIVETGKQDQEGLARRGNRLMYGGERVDSTTGERYHRLEPYGVSLIKGSWPTILAEIVQRGRYNQNAAKNLTNEGNMKVLRELAKTMDNNVKRKYSNIEGEQTLQNAFNFFLDTLKQYAERKSPKSDQETKINQEIVKKGRMS